MQPSYPPVGYSPLPAPAPTVYQRPACNRNDPGNVQCRIQRSANGLGILCTFDMVGSFVFFFLMGGDSRFMIVFSAFSSLFGLYASSKRVRNVVLTFSCLKFIHAAALVVYLFAMANTRYMTSLFYILMFLLMAVNISLLSLSLRLSADLRLATAQASADMPPESVPSATTGRPASVFVPMDQLQQPTAFPQSSAPPMAQPGFYYPVPGFMPPQGAPHPQQYGYYPVPMGAAVPPVQQMTARVPSVASTTNDQTTPGAPSSVAFSSYPNVNVTATAQPSYMQN